jgi:hypothetical protein
LESTREIGDSPPWDATGSSIRTIPGGFRPWAQARFLRGSFQDCMSLGLTYTDVQIVSLRTTVSQQSCALMQELAEALGPAFDPFVENVLPILGKMA